MQTITLLSKRAASATLFVLEFNRPEGFVFEAGQFARIGLEGPEGPVMRAYSIASSPEEDRLVFIITSVAGGALSPRLCALEPGASVLLEGGAEGSLLSRRIPGGRTLWMMATGSGLSPFVSMLGSKAFWAEHDDIVLVHGVRRFEDAILSRELVDRHLPGEFTLVVATTREDAGDLSGRIPALIASGELERHVERRLVPEEARVLLCGNPDFITATRAELKTRGIVSPRFGKPGQLVAENFW